MVIKSPQKRNGVVNIQLPIDSDGSYCSLQRKGHIKYLGVLIDDALNWKYHISYIKSRIARNTGIISILRHYLSLQQLKQLYYSIIYPDISYGILSWGSTYKTQLQNLQTKLNYVVRLNFFATAYRPYTDHERDFPAIRLFLPRILGLFKCFCLCFVSYSFYVIVHLYFSVR